MANDQDRRTELYDEATEVISDHGARDAILDSLEGLYFDPGDRPQATNAPAKDREAVEIVKMPWASNIVELIQDMMAAAGYNVAVASASTNVRAYDLAEDTEKFLLATIDQSQELQEQDFVSYLAWTVAMRGAVAGRIQMFPSWMEESETENEVWAAGQQIPIQIQMRDPRFLYPSFGKDGLRFIVEKQRRKVRDVRRTYGDHILPNKDPGTEVDWLEYWDADVYQFWADSEAMGMEKDTGSAEGPFAHTYGCNPYSYHFARQTGRPEPEKRMRPLLQPMKPVIEREDILESMRHTFISHYIGTGWITESMNRDLKFDPTPGAEHQLIPGEDIRPIQAGRQPLELMEAQARLDRHLERGTFPGTFFGEDPGRMMSGFALSILNQGGEAKLQPMVTAVERLMKSLCVNVLTAAEKGIAPLTTGPIPFYMMEQGEGGRQVQAEHKIDAAKLSGFYPVTVSLGDLMPQDELQQMQLAQQARTPGPGEMPLLSDRTILEKYKIADSPEKEREQILLEKVRNSPELMGLEAQLLIAIERDRLRDDLNQLDIDTTRAEDQIQAGEPLTAPMQELQIPPGGPPQPGLPPGFDPTQMQPGPGVPPEMLPPQMLGQVQPPPGEELPPEELGIPPAEVLR